MAMSTVNTNMTTAAKQQMAADLYAINEGSINDANNSSSQTDKLRLMQ